MKLTRFLCFCFLFCFIAAAQAQPEKSTPHAQQYFDFALRATQDVEKNLDKITSVAEIVAERHIKGGLVGPIGNGQGLAPELTGRAGGMINIGFGRAWSTERTPEQDAQNVAIFGWERAPAAKDLAELQKQRTAGAYIIGFGPREMPELAEHVKLCDAFFDTGLGADDRVVSLPGGTRAGRGNLLVNMLNGWAFTGELVAALTRRGKMPTMYKSHFLPGAAEWNDKYVRKQQFHDEYKIAPVEAGVLGRAYLKSIRAYISIFMISQDWKVARAAELIAQQSREGKPTPVGAMGHAPSTYIGKYEDARWARPVNASATTPERAAKYCESTADEARVLYVGYSGLDDGLAQLFREKQQRVILITTPTPDAARQPPDDVAVTIDMGWQFGDAVVSIEGYPAKILPPSGIMQIVAYEAINVEAMARLNHAN